MLAALLLAQVDSFETVFLRVGDSGRSAMVTRQATKTSAPLVFCFHGHGGGARSAQRSFGIEKLWPEAVVVYPHGVPTATANDPEGKRNGWQMRPMPSPNKDLVYFDELLAWVKKNRTIDPKRIYVMGHSNGGGFTYLLAAERGDLFAAFAPSAAAATRFVSRMPAKPVFHVSGTQDTTVAFADQQATHAAVKKKLGLEGVEGKAVGLETRYVSGGLEFTTYVYEGPHKYPDAANAAIVEFFKRH
jgi:polyhydroxybutyrate depolymerase